MNEEITTIQIKRSTHKQLKIIAAFSGKKLYELIEEAVDYLEGVHLEHEVNDE